MQQALSAPTIAAVAAHHGTGAMGVAVTAIVHGGMELFAPNRRMNAAQITRFAEDVVEQFRHESLADVALFMRGCADSKYDDGEFYGSVDIPRLKKWWAKYLEEKAAAAEVQADRSEHVLEQGMREAIGMIDTKALGKTVREFTIIAKERSDLVTKRNRLEKLVRQLPAMSDDAMREAWKIYRTSEERSVIQAEAARRGLLGDDVKAAQLEIDAQARANNRSGILPTKEEDKAESVTVIPMTGTPKEEELNTKHEPAA